MTRHDYAFPLRIDGSSRQAAESTYPEHVEQMIRQILLTSPGDRVDLPEFGCGIRRLLFAQHSSGLDSTTEILVRQSLDRWLGDQIEVRKVIVATPEQTGDAARLELEIDYVLVDALQARTTRVTIV
jgi:Bacteriophage baseplate protein W